MENSLKQDKKTCETNEPLLLKDNENKKNKKCC